jgi:ABC-2 type transport system permease protein
MSATTAAAAGAPRTLAEPATHPARRAGRLLAHQLRYELRAHRRNPVLLGFTIGMPLVFLGIFGILLGSEDVGPAAMLYTDFFVPNVVVLALCATCFAALGIALALRRGSGELKRVRGTPLPPWIVLAAMAGQAAVAGWVVAVLVVLCGWWWFGVAPPAAAPFAALLAVAAPSLAACGVAVATFIRRPENGPAATNLLLWPVAFVSGTFTWVPEGTVLHRVAQVLPVRHLNEAALAATGPGGATVELGSLLAVAAWGVIGGAVAVRRFGWEPRAA